MSNRDRDKILHSPRGRTACSTLLWRHWGTSDHGPRRIWSGRWRGDLLTTAKVLIWRFEMFEGCKMQQRGSRSFYKSWEIYSLDQQNHWRR